jgi:hypothetical protein
MGVAFDAVVSAVVVALREKESPKSILSVEMRSLPISVSEKIGQMVVGPIQRIIEIIFGVGITENPINIDLPLRHVSSKISMYFKEIIPIAQLPGASPVI